VRWVCTAGTQVITAVLSRVDGKKLGAMAIQDAAQAEALAARIRASQFQVRPPRMVL